MVPVARQTTSSSVDDTMPIMQYKKSQKGKQLLSRDTSTPEFPGAAESCAVLSARVSDKHAAHAVSDYRPGTRPFSLSTRSSADLLL